MERNYIGEHRLVVVVVLVLINLTVFVYGDITCPTNIAKECECKTEISCKLSFNCEPAISLNCSKNGEVTSTKVDVWTTTFEIKCTSNKSDADFHKLINLWEFDERKYVFSEIKIESCPINVYNVIKNSILKYIRRSSFSLAVDSTTVPVEMFNNISDLEILNIYGHNATNLENLPEKLFKTLNKLKVLTIRDTNITVLPANIFNNQTNLVRLELNRNELLTLPVNIFKNLTKLNWLNLGYNKITELPENLFECLKSLETLELTDNKIKVLPEKIFQSLNNLIFLELQQNELIALPENIFKSVTKLELLKLNGNNLPKIPENIFSGLNNLKELRINRNRLETLPANIFSNLTKLESLQLKGNNLMTLPAKVFSHLKNLRFFMLNGNNLTTLPEDIFNDFTNLRWMELMDNNITSLPENIFKNLNELGWMKLNGNKLTTLPKDIFKHLIKLRELNIEQNSLMTLPDGLFDSQTDLGRLFLRKNNLTTIPRNIFENLRSSVLYELSLLGNPWQCDCEFLNIFEKFPSQIDIVSCTNEESVCNRTERPIFSMIANKNSSQNYFKQKYSNSIIFPRISTNETAQLCPSECNCLISNNNTRILFDCSSNDWKVIPFGLTQGLHLIPTLQKIELDFGNNSIKCLPTMNSTMQRFELITKITATDNLIESIEVDNLPPNLMELDLSGNKLKSLSVEVIERLNEMKTLQKIGFLQNPWTCDLPFLEFVRLNMDKVIYEGIVCNDGEFLFQKHDTKHK